MKRRILLAGVASLSVLAAHGAGAQGGARKLRPRDDSARDPALRRVIDAIRAACKAKSTELLAPHLAEDVKESFGGDGSPAAFLAAFKKKPALWDELDTAFKLGGSFVGPSFAAPYVYSAFPENLEGDRYLVVLGDNVPVHETPRDTGIVAARLSYDIVRRATAELSVKVPPEWIRIRPPIGVPGYVRRQHLRSPIDYRAVLDKDKDRWVLTAFVAGD